MTIEPLNDRKHIRGMRTMRPVTAAMAVLVLALVGCGSSDGPTAIYDGAGCVYDGPTEFDRNSTVTFTVTNESDTTEVGFAFWIFPGEATPAEVHEQGIFAARDRNPAAAAQKVVAPPTDPGREYELTVTFRASGRHALNCFDLSGGEHDGNGLDYMTMLTVNG